MSESSLPPQKIGRFSLYEGRPTTMEYGYLYESRFTVPFDTRKRFVRVWVPGTYDFTNPGKHPVLYMADGQNLVDYYLTAFGDWHLDRVIRELAKEGYPEPILVGLDSPRNDKMRANELNPPYPPKRPINESIDHPSAHILLDFILGKVKPLVEKLFGVDTRREATGIGGSSMGGIFSFYAMMRHPDVFGYGHTFSIPFFFYTEKRIREMVEEWDPRPEKNGKLYVFVGGKGFERKFTKGCLFVADLLRERGFGEDRLVFDYDADGTHSEECWYRHSFPALRFWLKELQ